MDRDELIDFLRENLSITIDRDQGYYSYPHLEVKLHLCGQVIDTSSCTIYDGEHNG